MPVTPPHPPRRRRDGGPTGELRRRTPPQRLVDAINPLVRWLVTSRFHRLVDDSLIVLHVVGRRTGRRYDIPVGYVRLGDRLLVTTQHRWRANLRGCEGVATTVCGMRRSVRVGLDEDPASIAATFAEVIGRYGWPNASRRLGLTMASGQAPSRDQLEDAAGAYRLAVLELSAAPGEPPLVSGG